MKVQRAATFVPNAAQRRAALEAAGSAEEVSCASAPLSSLMHSRL